MKALYKITMNCVIKLYRGVDYVENYNKISFYNDDPISKTQLDEMLLHAEYGLVYFTYNKDLIHKYQRKIKKIRCGK